MCLHRHQESTRAPNYAGNYRITAVSESISAEIIEKATEFKSLVNAHLIRWQEMAGPDVGYGSTCRILYDTGPQSTTFSKATNAETLRSRISSNKKLSPHGRTQLTSQVKFRMSSFLQNK